MTNRLSARMVWIPQERPTPMTRTSIIPETTQIGRTALLVTNLDEMVDFYRDVVGLTVRTRNETTATLGANETPLLVLERDENASPRGREQAGLFHNAFKVPSRAALGAALDRVHDRWGLDGASDHYVSEALYLTDPEDNGIEIYRDRPQEEWPRADDGTVQIGTIPLDLDDVAAQSDRTTEVPSGTTVGHVHLEVSSIAAARAFYVKTLGLRVQTEAPSALFLAAGDYHHHLGVNTWNNRSQPAGGRGLTWFEFVVANEETFATVRRRLADADVSVTELTTGLQIADPDGITIRLRAK
jgi:catechol 2,3-dioxygenase